MSSISCVVWLLLVALLGCFLICLLDPILVWFAVLWLLFVALCFVVLCCWCLLAWLCLVRVLCNFTCYVYCLDCWLFVGFVNSVGISVCCVLHVSYLCIWFYLMLDFVCLC